MLEIIHKNTIKALLRKGQTWKGYLAPSNVASFHVNGGWHLGFFTEITSLEQLEEVSADFAYYNCNAELGQRVRYWQEK